MDGLRAVLASDSILPGPPIIQHNKSVVHNGQLKHSDLSASIVDIQLSIRANKLIEMIQKRNESVAPSPWS